MEIPYVVTPRKDTGLINSKIAIWLFLASEVMLFGGFFSAYVFLRIGADYPWPERALPVIPGLVNTFVLIASSVTVVFAWASLKLRQWGRFQAYMGFTILCACVFMVLKGIEYNVKFHHQALRMTDGAVVEGHLGSELKEGVQSSRPDQGRGLPPRPSRARRSRKTASSWRPRGLTFSSLRYHKDWVEEILKEAAAKNAKITLASDVKLDIKDGKTIKKEGKVFTAGTPLTVELLAEAASLHKEARAVNNKVRTEILREAWDEGHAPVSPQGGLGNLRQDRGRSCQACGQGGD
ncbi:MAG: cytochrome c oxidase subunit 3 [Luteolibacter sp.]